MKLYDERIIMLAWAAEKLKNEIEESILDEEDYRKKELGVNLVEGRESAKNLYVKILGILHAVNHRDTLLEHALSAVSKYSFLSVEELPVTVKKMLQTWPTEISRRKKSQIDNIMALRVDWSRLEAAFISRH